MGIDSRIIWNFYYPNPNLMFKNFKFSRIENSETEKKIYPFSQIAILSLVYSLTFGSELAVVSIFPQFLETTFSISIELAGVLGLVMLL
ncbi:MAG: hypothetical protein CM1200mP16_01740 [Nitrospina sp.]|nr:MAG: hypothetical protein CM1200mP16_01740 [Nitrospina sp.]